MGICSTPRVADTRRAQVGLALRQRSEACRRHASHTGHVLAFLKLYPGIDGIYTLRILPISSTHRGGPPMTLPAQIFHLTTLFAHKRTFATPIHARNTRMYPSLRFSFAARPRGISHEICGAGLSNRHKIPPCYDPHPILTLSRPHCRPSDSTQLSSSPTMSCLIRDTGQRAPIAR